ncbi:hypothetical protein BS78_06G014300 [Paspalum vaginatum]|nr:hypothetical protein BS78_06G014300 [Paspalum vaginatum]
MKNKIDHVPERITRLVVANSQQFYEIPIQHHPNVQNPVNTGANIESTNGQATSGSAKGVDIPSSGDSAAPPHNNGSGRKRQTVQKSPISHRHQPTPAAACPQAKESHARPQCAADQQDDDDFQQPAKRVRFKKPARKPPSDPSLALPKKPPLPTQADNADGGHQKPRTLFRCNPQHVLEAIEILNAPQRDRVQSFGWGRFLDIKTNVVESRELYLWLFERIDCDEMVLRVHPNTVLPLNKAAMATVLGVPSGSRPPPRKTTKEVSEDKRRLAAALDCEPSKITVQRLKFELAKGRPDDLSIRCFFLIVFNRMLFPTSAYNISNSEIEYTMDLESFADIDWQQAMLDDLREDAIQWKSAKQKFANPSTRSCTPFLLVYYLDNLDHPFNNNSKEYCAPGCVVHKETD